MARKTILADKGGRGMPRWLLWFAAVAVLAVVVWQLSSGMFVRSISGPAGTGLTFAPRDGGSAGQNMGNTIRQGGGSGNRAVVNGRDNRVEQTGEGNTATIGGLPPGWKSPGGGADDGDAGDPTGKGDGGH